MALTPHELQHAKHAPLTVGLVFHFNQNIVPMAYLGDQVCYRRLLETLLAHPKSNFTLHFSGTLLNALAWFGPETLDLLRTGVACGQFEILGSSYAQNILAATSMWDNVHQLREHQKVINAVLGVSPRGFWNPERCWHQDLASLLLNAGYEYTFIETNVFRRAGDILPQAAIRAVEADGRRLVCFNDDTNSLTLFGKSVRTGSADEFVEYLYGIWLMSRACPQFGMASIYAQDAEATGLWQFEGGGQAVDDVFRKLDRVLCALECQPWMTVGHLAATARSSAHALLPELPAGQANWMVDVLRSENMPWQEVGYADWFDYQKRSAKNLKMRGLSYRIGKALRENEDEMGKDGGHAAAGRLHDLALRTYAVHQYEFGCIGIAVDKEAQWQLVRSALVPLWASRLARYAREDCPGMFWDDVNADGVKEILVVSGKNAYAFTPRGGRLLYWFDLERGSQLVGNQNVAYYLERYQDDNVHLPDLLGGKDVYPQHAGKSGYPQILDKRFVVRRRALNDTFCYDDVEPIGLQDAVMDVELDSKAGTLSFHHDDGSFSYIKEVSFQENGLDIHYAIRKLPGENTFALTVENEVTPDYLTIMDHGFRCLEVIESPQGDRSLPIPVKTVGVHNRLTGYTIWLKISPFASSSAEGVGSPPRILLEHEAGFLAWLLRGKAILDPNIHEPGPPWHFAISLAAGRNEMGREGR